MHLSHLILLYDESGSPKVASKIRAFPIESDAR